MKNGKKIIYNLCAIALLIIVSILIFKMLQGKIISVGKYPNDYLSTSIACTEDNYSYPFFDNNDFDSANTKIDIILKDEKLMSISLVQQATYNNTTLASAASALNHASMNKYFGTEFGADAFHAHYITINNVFKMSLYANNDDLKTTGQKFFLINHDIESYINYEDYYTKLGFKCITQ